MEELIVDIFICLVLFAIWFGGTLVQLWRYDKGDLNKTGNYGHIRNNDKEKQMSAEDILFGVIGWPFTLSLFCIFTIITLPYKIPKYTYQWLKTD